MDIKIVGQTEPTKTELQELQDKINEDIPQQVLDSAEPGIINQTAIKQALEIEKDKNVYEREVNTLMNWVKTQLSEEEIKDPVKIKWAIRDLRMRLGTPAYGDPIKHIARYASLVLDGKRIEKEKESMVHEK